MIIIVLGILMVLAILGFSLFRTVSETSNVVYGHTYAQLLDLAGFELTNVIIADIGRDLKDPASALFQSLLHAAPGDFPLAVTGKNARWVAASAFSGRPEYRNLSASIDVKFVNPVALGNALTDPLEKRFQLTIFLDLGLGKTAWRRLHKTYSVEYPGKLQRLAPPLLSKFTLLIREPERTDHTAPGYNCFENRIDGSPIAASPNKPLVCIHRSALEQRDVDQVGWVGLGGTRDVQLHLTSGGDARYGEFFLFYSLGNPGLRPPLFSLTTIPATPPFSGMFTLGTAPLIQAKLGLQGALFGFYVVDHSTPPQDMNYNNTLETYFAAAGSRTMASSMLHLYGSLANPSPTRVFGRVKRVFGQYTAVVGDLSPGDGRNDFVLTMLKNPATFVGPGGPVDFWSSLAPVNSVSLPGFPGPQPINSLTMQALFGTETAYRSTCSRLVMEDFNRGYDYLMDDTMQVPPPQQYRTRFSETRHTLTNVSLSAPDGRTIGPVDLQQLTASALLTHRVSLKIDDEASLKKEFFAGTTFNPRGQVLLVKAPRVTLPRNLQVQTSGVLAVEGDICLQGGIVTEPDAVLTLVSLGGNIEIQTTNEDIQAYLAALDGTVKCSGAFPAKIVGGMAVKTLQPTDWPNGGTITWDDRLDPAKADDSSSYAVQMADYCSQWEIKSQ